MQQAAAVVAGAVGAELAASGGAAVTFLSDGAVTLGRGAAAHRPLPPHPTAQPARKHQLGQRQLQQQQQQSPHCGRKATQAQLGEVRKKWTAASKRKNSVFSA